MSRVKTWRLLFLTGYLVGGNDAPDPKKSPVPLNPKRGPHKERAVGSRQRSRRPTGSSLAASDEAAASTREVPDYPSDLSHDSYMDGE